MTNTNWILIIIFIWFLINRCSFLIYSDLRAFLMSFFFKVIDFERFNLQSIQVAWILEIISAAFLIKEQSSWNGLRTYPYLTSLCSNTYFICHLTTATGRNDALMRTWKMSYSTKECFLVFKLIYKVTLVKCIWNHLYLHNILNIMMIQSIGIRNIFTWSFLI